MTDTQTATIADLTRSDIRRRTDALVAKERQLTDHLVAIFQSGKSGGQIVDDRERKVHDGARRYLNGAGALLKPISAESDESDAYLERESVRLALRTLQAADFEKEAIEGAEKAISVTPRFVELQRLWLIAAAQFQAVANACWQFEDALDGPTRAALPGSFVPLLNATIDWPRNLFSKYQTIEEIIEYAITADLVGRADIAKARKVPG